MGETIAKTPLIVVRRRFYDAFCSGDKTIEYRRNRPPFTAHTFHPGRTVRLTYRYDLPGRLARVVAFGVRPASSCPDLSAVYPDLAPKDDIALIELALID